MKKFYLSLLCAAIWLASQGMVSATPVTFTDSANTTVSWETFTFTETVTIPSLSFGVFTILAQGDYDDWAGPEFEYLDWDIDGIVSGTGWGPTNNDLALTLAPDNVTWYKTITLAPAIMDSIFSDNSFTVTIQNSPDVDPVQATDGVSYTLQYFDGSTTGSPVPEPTTMLLLGSGLIGLAGLRRKLTSRSSR
jgi:hypothetical protein